MENLAFYYQSLNLFFLCGASVGLVLTVIFVLWLVIDRGFAYYRRRENSSLKVVLFILGRFASFILNPTAFLYMLESHWSNPKKRR